MKTAKKLLALVLVLVMVFGLVQMASAEFKDADDIENTEAVDVLVALNIVNGRDDGNYDPTATVTRAEAAAIIARMLVKRAIADSLPNGATGFSDVPSDIWYAKYVAFCVSQGIIVGRSATIFDPNAPVTAAEFAVMLMRALGIGDPSRWVGPNWAMFAILDGMAFGILSGDGDFSGACSRDSAALFAFNALIYGEEQTKTETYWYVIPTASPSSLTGAAADAVFATKYSSELAAVNGGMSVGGLYNANPTANSAAFTVISETVTVITSKDSIAEKVYKMVKVVKNDEFGRPGLRTWDLDGETISSVLTSSPTLVYTAKVSKSAMGTNLTTYNMTSVIPVVNGRKVAAVSNTDGIADLTSNGTIVEIYTNGSRRITDIVVIRTDYAYVSAINAARKTIALTTDSATVVAAAYTVTDEDDVYDDVKDLKVNDTVIVTPLWDGKTAYDVFAVAFATEVEGNVTFRNGTTGALTVGGTVYALSRGATSGSSAARPSTVEQTLFLDTFGYVVDVKGPPPPGAVNFVFVTREYKTLDDGALVDKIKGVLPDGTEVDVEYAGVTPSPGNLYRVAVGTDGVYTLSAAGTAATASGRDLAADKAIVNLTTSISAGATRLNPSSNGDNTDYFENYFSPNVKFFYWSSNKLTVKDGVQAIQSIPAGSVAVVENDRTGRPIVTAIFIKGAPMDYEPDALLFLADKTPGDQILLGSTWYDVYYDVYKNGELIEDGIYLAKGIDWSTATGIDDPDPNFYTYSVNADGAYILTEHDTSTGASAVLRFEGIISTYNNRLITIPSLLDDLNIAGATIIDVRDPDAQDDDPIIENAAGLCAAVSTYGAAVPSMTVEICVVFNSNTLAASLIFITDLY